MSIFKSIIVKFIILIGKKSFLGRGNFRKILLTFLEILNVETVETDYKKIPFIFHLDNPTERRAIFGRYNEIELDFILHAFKNTAGIFIDIGANSGLYSCFIANRAPTNSKIFSIEPNPIMIKRIRDNLSRQSADKDIHSSQMSILECGLGAAPGKALLDMTNGYGSAAITEKKSIRSIDIEIKTLQSVCVENNISTITALKIDVEGYEDKVLVPFFKTVDKSMYPKVLVIEHTSITEWNIDVLEFLNSLGYREIRRTRGNALFEYSFQ